MHDILAKLDEDMELRGFTDSTRQTYRRTIRIYLEHIAKPIALTSEKDLRDYSLYLRHKKGLAAQTINAYLSALVFLYEVVCDRPLHRKQIPYRKRSKKLPVILTREEVISIIDAATNVKHKAILMLAYSAGLRRSEIANLKVQDIDSDAMRIFVRAGKGSKDRYTVLSKTCLEVLRRYWTGFRPDHPEKWLFLGMGGKDRIAFTTMQSIFAHALARSGIAKPATFHTLRHCFATHLLEGGASVFDVKELLGHTSLSTTSIYLHLVNISDRVASPLDVPLRLEDE